MLDALENDLEMSVLTNIFYGENIDLAEFFTTYSPSHFTNDFKTIFSMAKELWIMGKDIYPVVLKISNPELAQVIDDIYSAPLINYRGNEVALGKIAQRKRGVLALKDALRKLELDGEDYFVVKDMLASELEKEDNTEFQEAKTIYEIAQEEIAGSECAPCGLSYIDEGLFDEDGGFEYGQLVTITGEQEAGKTQLLNQILFGMGSKKIHSLYFSLEFNKRSFQKYLMRKKKFNGLDMEATKYVRFYSDEDTTGNVFEIENMIRKNHKNHGVRVVAIDSQMMLEAEGIDSSKRGVSKSEEANITKVYRTLHRLANKLDILIFIIAQGSKEDNKSKRVEIFGSKRAGHLARIMLHMEKEFVEPGEEQTPYGGQNKKPDPRSNNHAGIIDVQENYFMRVAKNKQSGKHPRANLNFDKDSLEFWVSPKDKVSGMGGCTVVDYRMATDTANASIVTATENHDEFVFGGGLAAYNDNFNMNDGGVSDFLARD